MLVGDLLVWLVAALSLACRSCMSPGRLPVHLSVSVRWRVVLPEVRILSTGAPTPFYGTTILPSAGMVLNNKI
jgi:hypothetical protein